MQQKIEVMTIGENLQLRREQWRGKHVTISNYDGLLDEVLKYTWTYTAGKHPYIRCARLNQSLHYFVLAFLYGKNKLDTMLQNRNIIEHLDNNGLNCTYENLHILSSDENTAKALTVDKRAKVHAYAPVFITDVYYSHKRKYFQMQLTYNEDVFLNIQTHQPVEQIVMIYETFNNLFSDWLVVSERCDGRFDFSKFRCDCLLHKDRPIIELKPEEKDATIIERDGTYYLRLNPNGGSKATWIEKTHYINFENINRKT